MSELKAAVAPKITAQNETESKLAVLSFAANEFIFAVVGHVGSGTTSVAKDLERLLEAPAADGSTFEVSLLKARDVIAEWAKANGKAIPSGNSAKLSTVETFQDYGDEMRAPGDYAAVAKGLVRKIQEARAAKTGVQFVAGEAVKPDGKKRAYILDSIRHPAEVELLRHIYQEAFILIGVVCEEDRRLLRVMKKFSDAGETNARLLMQRDAKSSKHGQRVSDAFHMSDYFLDNTVERFDENQLENKHWDINEKLSRLLKIVQHSFLVRPEIAETAMHHASGAAMQSACLSRQVGAALVDRNGNIAATGTNEVPKAGGGVYGDSFEEGAVDHRCAFQRKEGALPFCSNTVEQNAIINDLISEIPELKTLGAIERSNLKETLRKGRIGDLIEFSRAVHAEMDAILTAGREGTTTIGTRLYVTTFPCHYCARHILSAGVDEVQYIEPYPKSKALALHRDAIEIEGTNWIPPSKGGKKVLFRPFVGVAPRLYKRAFLKDRELKNGSTGTMQVGNPDWGTPWHLRTAGYVELEAALAKPTV